jgi:hypothetical protein
LSNLSGLLIALGLALAAIEAWPWSALLAALLLAWFVWR